MRPLLNGSMGHARFVCFALVLILASLFLGAVPTIATQRPDPVLDWIKIMNDTAISAGTNPLVTSRVGALVSGSIYDAVNGIEPRYQPLFVKPNAPRPASQRAAAIQAAYAMLLHLYPTANLDAARNASLAALAPYEKPDAISNGVTWGQTVADAIWAWRLNDGLTPPHLRSKASSVSKPPLRPSVLGALHLPPTPQALVHSSQR